MRDERLDKLRCEFDRLVMLCRIQRRALVVLATGKIECWCKGGQSPCLCYRHVAGAALSDGDSL